MAMIFSSTMLVNATPAPMPQVARTGGAAQPSGGGRFAGLLQEMQPSKQPAVAQKGAPDDAKQAPAASQQDAAQPQKSNADQPETMGQQVAQQVTDQAQAAPTGEQRGQGKVQGSGKGQNADFLESDAEFAKTSGTENVKENGLAVANPGKGLDQWKALGDLQRAALAAEAQKDAPLLDIQQGNGAVVVTLAEAKKGADSSDKTTRGTDETAQDKTPASAAQDDAALLTAAQQGLAALFLVAGQERENLRVPETVPESGEQAKTIGQAPVGAVAFAPDDAANFTGMPTDTQNLMPGNAGLTAATEAAAQGSVQGAAQGPVQGVVQSAAAGGVVLPQMATVLPASAPEAKSGPVTTEMKPPANDAASVATAAPKVEATVAPGQDKIRFAQENGNDSARKAEANHQPERTVAASEVFAQQKVTANDKGHAAAQAVDPDQQQASAATDADPSRTAQPAEGRNLRAAMAFHGTYGELRGIADQSGAKTEVSVEEAGVKVAVAASAGKTAQLQGSLSQNGTDSGGERHPEQKAPGDAGAVLQPQGVGPHPTTQTEAPLPEAKAPASQGALHESILSQIKDGVVTRDDKGNSQMSIRLNPGELGELRIQVRMDDNRVTVQVHADNRMVKDLLMSNLDSLKESLGGKDFTMDGFNVSTGGGSSFSSLPEQKENSQQQSFLRTAKAGGYGDQGEETRVNYLTDEVNNLLDVRF